MDGFVGTYKTKEEAVRAMRWQQKAQTPTTPPQFRMTFYLKRVDRGWQVRSKRGW